MNNQEIFDTAALHLIKQGKPGINEHQDCQYRGEGGTMCAIGALIPDDVYEASLEDLSPTQLVNAGHITNVEDDDGPALMDDLQSVHDVEFLGYDGEGSIVPDFDCWGRAMRDIANEYDLNTNVLYDALKEAGHNVPS